MENTNFEAIEKIAIHMADTCLKTDISGRIKKLEEEFAELMAELTPNQLSGTNLINRDKAQKEMGDVLFVLLHLANKMGTNATELLHYATNKMLNRIVNPDYDR